MITLVKVSDGGKTVHRFPLDGSNSGEVPMPARPSAPLLVDPEVQRRFEICKTCEHSDNEGFKCKLHSGCCFGRWRANINNHCIEGKW